MAEIQLDISHLPLLDLFAFSHTLVTRFTGNADAPAPVPTTVNFGTDLTAAETANNDYEATKELLAQKKTLRDDKAAVVKNNVRNWANYGQSVTQGNAAKLQGLGFALRGPSAPVGTPDQVMDLAATEGDNEGSLDCMWKPTRGANSYEIETSAEPNPPTSWTHRDTVTASKATLTGLTSGSRVWVRVRAVGTGGLKGPWSDPAVKVVP